MIWGIYYKDQNQEVSKDDFQKMGDFSDGIVGSKQILQQQHFALGSAALPHIQKNDSKPAISADKLVAAVFQGKIYNLKELISEKEEAKFSGNQAKIILHLYEILGGDFVKKLNGKFVFAIFDKRKNKVILGRDRFGIEPLYYLFDNKKIIFSTTLKSIVDHPEVKKEINFHALYQFLLFCYNPAMYTFYKNIHKLRPGHLLEYTEQITSIEPYWKLSFATLTTQKEEEICEELLALMKDAIKIRIDDTLEKGVFLSGGMDSSTVVALTTSYMDNQLRTFSYRCKGVSFDESHYAQIVADHYHTLHELVEYSADDVESIKELVGYMDEPFCDVGINIATYILAKAVENKVNCIFSGDGGDELYGGHPVYVADQTAKFIDVVPRLMMKPFLKVGDLLPDSDKKKNFVVKVKRFSQSYHFPKELLSHRWRIYYNHDEIHQLLDKDLITQINSFDPYQVMLRFNKESDGRDILSKSIHSDYNTIVGFYLRRMGLLKHFGVEARFPLLDHRLVEYAAKIPSRLKMKGFSDTKYIFKKTMENVLPHDIVYRKDKLGHSIPLKNWMRDDQQVKTFISDMLSESVVKNRGFFNYEYVHKLLEDHLSKKTNNSHRLWALVVLELWLGNNL